MHWLDWVVIAGYMVSMLAIGEYYARRTKSSEDYLLGNRRMGSFSVGLSLFASLFSTVTYLAMPGEMINHGPMASAKVLGYPLVYLILGYTLIPCFMRLRVTSAYEILEQRFGLSVRLLGSSMFLLLRLLWMGVIIFETSAQVLIPVMHLPEWTIPYACIAMGLITVVYTSAGGLKAVVMTDAVQSFILLFGAVLTLIVVTWSLGSVGAWWPTEWHPEWDKFRVGIDPDSRFTLSTAVMGGMLWWICTGGSDQIAIQRYLATRDLRAARSVLGVSLVTNVVTVILLGLVGMSLIGYFRVHPELLTETVSLTEHADQMFTRFIVIGLPPGVSGLVIAALLAAAMSSLSSGLNSSCLVIAVDFIDRFRKTVANEAQKVRETKIISWIVGLLPILMSAFVSTIEGNILEVTFKTANLLMAPLFILFFMAVFVPWATVFGTWTATICATVTAIIVAYPEKLGLADQIDMSFIWITPLALLVGMVTGCVASLLPISPRCPPLETHDSLMAP